MDVFFCDLCGARVNDADLKSGQGQRSQWDVICGSCLEQGLGKEWLGKRVSARHAVATSAAASNAKLGRSAADPRDRVATLDEAPPEPPAASAPVVAAPPKPEPGYAPVKAAANSFVQAPAFALAPPPAILTAPDFAEDLDDLGAAAGAGVNDAEAPLLATAKVSPPSPAADSQLAAAANVFSALGSNSGSAARRSAAHGDDDDLVDRAYATPAEQLSPARGSPALGESPFGAQVHLGNAEKDETALVAALPGTEEADLKLGGDAPAKKSGSSTTARRKAAKGGSNRIAKSGGKSANGTSSRKSVSRGKDRSMMVLMVGIGLLVLIGGAFAVMMMNKGSGSRTTTAAPDAETAALRKELKSVETQAIAAIRGTDLNAKIAARNSITTLQNNIQEFDKSMKKQGNSDAQIGGFLKGLHTSDVMMHKITLNNEIIKLQNQKK